MRRDCSSFCARAGLAGLLCLTAASARADTFSVGGDPACTHITIQAAIDAAVAVGGTGIHVIAVANNSSYTNQALVVDAISVHLVGGFSDCSATPAVETATPTTLSGAGNGGLPVLSVLNAGDARISVTVENIDLAFGGGGVNTSGGGLRIRGAATVTLKGVHLHDNQGNAGGGIHVEGLDAMHTAEVLLEQSHAGPGQRVSVLERNRARAGGGIFVGPFAQAVFWENAVSILDNEALNAGGVLVGANATALFNLPSGNALPPVPGLQGNRATSGNGGALIVEDGGFVSVDQGQASAGYMIRDNEAAAAGGGIYAVGEGSGAILYAAHIEDNLADADTNNDGCGGGLHARNGASIHLSGNVAFLDCTDGAPCASLGHNRAARGGGACAQEGGTIGIAGVHMQGNGAAAGAALSARDSDSRIDLDSVLISDSHSTLTSGATVSVMAGAEMSAAGVTLAGNPTGGALVEVLGESSASFIYSILYQPGRTALNVDSNSNVGAGCVLSHAAWPVAGDVRVGDPLFADPGAGDYSLTTDSPAVDACADIVELELDLHAQPRGIDLARVQNLDGPYDLGAFELQRTPEIFADGFESD